MDCLASGFAFQAGKVLFDMVCALSIFFVAGLIGLLIMTRKR